MSYWVYLRDEDGKNCEVDRHSEGGTHAWGGIPEAELNITYNYSKHYYRTIDKEKGLRWLHNKKAKKCIKRLENATKILGIEKNYDYWLPTMGNAGYALWILWKWAKLYPEATFEVN